MRTSNHNSIPSANEKRGREAWRVATALFAIALAMLPAACSEDVLTGGAPSYDATGAPPPTGTRWQEVPVPTGCGRETTVFLPADELCGAIGTEEYFDAFVAPIFRDGALIDGTLYAIDASFVWALDASPGQPLTRLGMVSGFGQPMAVADHNGRLLIAAARDGLVGADLTNPSRPTRPWSLSLSGSAMDLSLVGDTAFVAAGGGGVDVVDLTGGNPSVIGHGNPGGYAVGVESAGGFVYVAACDRLAVLDAATGRVVGQTWLPDTTINGILVAPAKDVAVVGSVAFVAAGRYGVVAIDVSVPTHPRVIGNCTLVNDLQFYGNGVRRHGDTLYVAAGEWGVMALDVSDPLATCPRLETPQFFFDEFVAGECVDASTWVELPPPPLPTHDPLQVLPVATGVYAFGDASRIGMRAVDVYPHFLGQTDLRLGRFEEPRLIEGIAAGNGRVITFGPNATLFAVDSAALLLPTGPLVGRDLLGDPLDEPVLGGAFFDDGRWVIATASSVTVQGTGTGMRFGDNIHPDRLVVRGSILAVPTDRDVTTFDVNSGQTDIHAAGRVTRLKPAVALRGDDIFMAGGEWQETVNVRASEPVALTAHGVFTITDILNPDLWRRGPPSRLLVDTAEGLLEVATLHQRGGAMLHRASGGGSLAIPAAPYVAGVAVADRIFLVSGDRGAYRSMLLEIQVTPLSFDVAQSIHFTGVATGIAADQGLLYVADADQGIRVFDSSGGGLQPLGVVSMEAAP